MKRLFPVALFLAGSLAGSAQTYTFTTLAGALASGSNDGPGATARFNQPKGLVVDAAGNVFVADSQNSVIRKITPDGVVSTFAGTAGSSGNADGIGASARFGVPNSLALDASGNLYVSDGAIRKITPDGAVSTLPDSPAFGVIGGLAAEENGNLIASSRSQNTILKVIGGSGVAALAGQSTINGRYADGTGAAAQFNFPEGVALDAAGNVYVADWGNHNIRKITPASVVTTIAGNTGGAFSVFGTIYTGFSGSADGIGTASYFNRPRGIAVDRNGTVFVADSGNRGIRRITPDGTVSTVAGGQLFGAIQSVNGTGSIVRFIDPQFVAVGRDGTLYVTDFNSVRKGVLTLINAPPQNQIVAPGGTAALTVASVSTAPMTYQWRKDGVDLPGAVDATLVLGRVQAGDTGSYSVVVRDANGNVSTSGAASVATTPGEPIYLFTTLAGVPGQPAGVDGTGSGARFKSPRGLAFDAAGNLLVADSGNHTIRRVSPGGVVTTVAGANGVAGRADGPGPAARFSTPSGVAVTADGAIFVTDSANSTLRRIAPDGTVTTFAGTAGERGDTNGTGSAARFAFPTGIAVNAAGNLLVVDSNTIRHVALNGAVAIMAGLPYDGTVYGNVDGPSILARFSFPTDLAVEPNGSALIADWGNATLRRLTPNGVVSTFAGLPGRRGGGDALLAAAQFGNPSGIAVDRTGAIFVTDTNNTVRKITPAGVVTTIGGLPAAYSEDIFANPALLHDTRAHADGIGGAARFDTPYGIIVDPEGVLYIADTGNHIIRKGVPLSGLGTSRLANLSVRSIAGTGNDTLIVGFSLAGRGTTPILLRGVGPGLAAFGVAGTLADPTLRLDVLNGALVGQNDNWDTTTTPGGAAAVATAAANTGAFPLPAASRDAALLSTLGAGSYTVQIGGGTGVALVEAYDAGGGATLQLSNVSARTRAGPGAETLIAGFVVGGTAPKAILIRAIGPTLALFGVGGVLADPKLELSTAGGALLAENDNWGSPGGEVGLAAAFRRAGAFELPAGSKDAALLVTLAPGGYTVQISGVGGTRGVALVELFDLP